MTRAIAITGASKGIGLAAAHRLAAQGWHVIGIARRAPTAFPGDFIEVDLSHAAATDGFLSFIPMGRFGKPDEIAAAIAFFASDDAAFITEQSLYDDGGSSLARAG